MKLKAVIVDDEFPATQLIREHCRKLESLEIVSTFTNAVEAFNYISKSEVQLLFLDVQMPFMSGIELLKRLTEKPMCIFITASPEYAVRAFELDVIDYLVKPVPFDRFKKAVEKAIEFYEYRMNQSRALTDKRYLMIRADYKIIKINTADIHWIEGSGEYVKIKTDDHTILALDSLTRYIESVLPEGFIRIHKSFIVPLSRIKSFVSTAVTLNDGKEFPIGRTYKEEVIKVLRAQ
jgi:two-component system, LytTR family, response regulator LytT